MLFQKRAVRTTVDIYVFISHFDLYFSHFSNRSDPHDFTEILLKVTKNTNIAKCNAAD